MNMVIAPKFCMKYKKGKHILVSGYDEYAVQFQALMLKKYVYGILQPNICLWST